MPEIKIEKTNKKRSIGSKGKWYSPLTDTIYNYQSAYERELMRYFDDHKICWVKNKDRFSYYIGEVKHFYIPDFYLPEFDLYIETKGFLRASDPLKFKAFPDNKKLVLLMYEDLKQLGCNVFDPRSSCNDLNKWPMTILSKNPEWQVSGELSPELKEKISSKLFFEKLSV